MKERFKPSSFKAYKLKGLNLYSSGEWMGVSRRKYRTVFEKNEINYLKFELSFYNKLFDEKDWKAEIKIVINRDDTRTKEFYNKSEEIEVSKEDNIVYYDSSWGIDDYGGYWETGLYIIYAYIDSELIGKRKFAIYNYGVVNQTVNPYFDVMNMRLYESEDGNPELGKYQKIFKRDATRFVGVELEVENKIAEEWHIEYYVLFFDDAGQLKARTEHLAKVDKGSRTLKLYSTWGNSTGKSWKDDKYIVNVVFMDTLVASTSFEMAEEAVEGNVEFSTGTFDTLLAKQVNKKEDVEKTKAETFDDLNNLIGLSEIKNKINDYIKYIDFLKIRKEKGLHNQKVENLHSVFMGNPGTGKTTVARLLGSIYHKMGLLSKGHVVEVGRVELIAEFLGKTAPKTQKMIEKARGGVLFIDEAYSLTGKGKEDYGNESIEVILKEMSDGKGDLMIVVAGYPAEMNEFIEANPGLKSRFKYYFDFPDYTPDELVEIARYAVKKHSLKIDEKAVVLLREILVKEYRKRDRNFGNARFVHSLIDEAKMNMGLRIVSNADYKELSDIELSTIKEADIQELEIHEKEKQQIDFKIDEKLLRSATNELDKYVGMTNIKREIRENIKLVRYYQEIGKNILNTFSMHSVFTGNPGTGKTTIARIIAKVYKALGLLERGHLVETSREGLVAGYLGQTAIKTKEMLNSAMGGVLFIDEAYGLTNDEHDYYGKEAIEVILKFMEDNRGKIAVIAAGYPNNMNTFLKSNPGLMSRFDKILHFHDYSIDELLNIADLIAEQNSLIFNSESRDFLRQYVDKLYSRRDKTFGNARVIRQLVEDIVKRQHLRMANVDKDTRTPIMISSITIADVSHLTIEEQVPKSAPVGFNS